jgi:hypothetical protein
MTDPVRFWVPSIATSGLMIYSGDKFPMWYGSIFSGALAGEQLALHARLLHALDVGGLSTRNLAHDLEDGARLLLARIRIDTSSPDSPTVNPGLIHINNLVRPFLTTASQLAWLTRQPGSE